MIGIFCLVLSLSLPAFAEYRAYQLAVINEETGKELKVISTLDNFQYATYYPLSKGDRVEYVDSWMCWEDSAYHEPICKNPGRLPASNALPKTNSPNLEP